MDIAIAGVLLVIALVTVVISKMGLADHAPSVVE